MPDKVTFVVEMTEAAEDPKATLHRLASSARPSSLEIGYRFDSPDVVLRRFLSLEVDSDAAPAVLSRLKASPKFVADVVREPDAEPG